MYVSVDILRIIVYLDDPVSRGFTHPTKPRETNLYLPSRPTSAALTSSSGRHYSVLTELLQIVRIYHSYAIAVGYIAR